MNRYYVFGYNSFYPRGGMSDCLHKTNNRDVAVRFAVKERDEGLTQHVSVWDVVKEVWVSVPEEDE